MDNNLSTKYDSSKFDRPDGFPIDNCIFTITTKGNASVRKSLPKKELNVLLIKRKTFTEPKPDYPFQGQWALPGGFSERNETLQEAAFRELNEEANVGNDVYLEQFKTVYYPGRDPRGWMPTCVYVALVKEETLLHRKAGDDAQEVGIFSINDVLEMELAFDHKEIILEALERIKEKMLTTTIAKEFLPKEFTIAQLLQVLQTVVPDFKVEKPNFIRKIVGTSNRKGLLTPSLNRDNSHRLSDEFSNRAAKLYKFNQDYNLKISIYNSTLF